jgi:MFS family permease
VGRALAHRNFRLFFCGQSISLIGTWMQQVAMIWLVYKLSGSPFWLGVVGFSSQIPAFLAAPVAGVLTDRWNRHHTVLVTQTLAMIQAFALMGLTLAGVITIWQIILLGMLLGLVNAFDMPTRQSFLVQMVDEKADLANAIALNSSMFNAARLIGPSIAGFVIGLLGEWPCFLLNGLSYLAVLASLLAMRVKPIPRPAGNTRIWEGLKEGLAYVARSRPIRALLSLLGLVSMMSMPLTVLLPVVATDVLGGGPDTLGLLTAASGVGALGASLFLAARSSPLGLGRLIAVATGVFGLGMVGLSLSHVLWLSLATLVVTGFAMLSQMAATNTILQTIVEEDKRGRVMSLYTMAFFGMAPLGSLMAGSLASRIGTPATILAFGLVSVAGSLVFALLLPGLRRVTRPIYVQAGLLPDAVPAIQPTASGIQSFPKA